MIVCSYFIFRVSDISIHRQQIGYLWKALFHFDQFALKANFDFEVVLQMLAASRSYCWHSQLKLNFTIIASLVVVTIPKGLGATLHWVNLKTLHLILAFQQDFKLILGFIIYFKLRAIKFIAEDLLVVKPWIANSFSNSLLRVC